MKYLFVNKYNKDKTSGAQQEPCPREERQAQADPSFGLNGTSLGKSLCLWAKRSGGGGQRTLPEGSFDIGFMTMKDILVGPRAGTPAGGSLEVPSWF